MDVQGKLAIPQPATSVALHGGDLLNACFCLKRNGLQHECPKLECQGTEQCLTVPIPTCQPSGLGEPPAKPILVSKATVVSCNEETSREKRRRLSMEKKAREKLYLDLARRYYNDNPCPKEEYHFCPRHDGTFIRKRILRDKLVQTGESSMEICRCMKNGYEREQYANVVRYPDGERGGTNEKKSLSKGIRYKIPRQLQGEVGSFGIQDADVESQLLTKLDECQENIATPLKTQQKSKTEKSKLIPSESTDQDNKPKEEPTTKVESTSPNKIDANTSTSKFDIANELKPSASKLDSNITGSKIDATTSTVKFDSNSTINPSGASPNISGTKIEMKPSIQKINTSNTSSVKVETSIPKMEGSKISANKESSLETSNDSSRSTQSNMDV